MANMKVLLTNDDGVESPGVEAARAALLRRGIGVVTVAPDGPRSGTSRSASFRKPVWVKQVGGDDANPVYASNGTPADCVRVGVFSGLADDAQLVISGINEGANLGDDSTYSSTFGSAIEGALLGFPAIAASQQARDARFRLVDLEGYDFEPGADLLARFAERMIEDRDFLPERSVLNLNAPARAYSSIVLAGFDRRVWKREDIPVVETENGPGYYVFATDPDRDPRFEHRPGSDTHALLNGMASVTPVNLSWTDVGARRRLVNWTKETISEFNSHMENAAGSAPETRR